MKAIVCTRYGPPDVLRLGEVEKPVPGANEVLIRIHATTVTAGDCEMRALKFPLWLSIPMRFYNGLVRPSRIKIIGQELAGEVAAVGKNVTAFRPGAAVFGTTGFNMGAYAEYITLPEKGGEMDGALAHKPVSLTYAEAAAAPLGGLEALHFLRLADLHNGEKILIIGAGGSIGTMAVQLARYFGAVVTGVDRGEKMDLLGAIGAERAIDFTREDFSREGEQYDVVFDVVGKASFARCMRSLKPGGRYVLANPSLADMLRGAWASRTGDKKVIFGAAKQRAEDLVLIKELIEGGKLKPVVDRSYPLEQAVEAHRYVESGNKKGNVVIAVAASG
ncbi:MAG: NAD(P)-dependent alcohol dehydrogenase [Anaerolineaceae bacterium]|nr:NAD(P)-dependent alcohol dehydrogenase [Anaerolineaceae bacterium]